MNNKKILAIIPARGGSKGLLRKNVVLLNGNPLIYYSIDAALKSNFIDSVVVSSDDEEILQTASGYGVDVLKRPHYISTDTASANQVILHVLENEEIKSQQYDLVILLQPTSPLRGVKHIDEAFNILSNKDSNSLISVCTPDKSPYKSFILNEHGYLKGLINDEAPFMNRQELPDVFNPNGAIYIFSVKDFLQNSCIPVDQVIPYVMDEKESIDIDNQNDLDMASKIMYQLGV